MFDTLWAQFLSTSPIDWVAMFAGIIGVLLSIKERVSAWPFFILCYSAYIYISFRSGYYAFGGMNIAFVGIAAYGWGKWSGLISNNEHAFKISLVPSENWFVVALFMVVCTLGIGTLLAKNGDARLPYLDAFATSSAFTAQWMLSRKYVENWLFWIISDCIYISFFFNDKIWPSVILFSIFIILACKGWRDWKQLIAQNCANSVI